MAASWTATSLNRTAPDASLRPFDRAAVDIRASGSFGPPRHRDRTRFALDFSDYAVRPSGGTGGSEDGVTQAMASLQFDLGADVTPLTLSALGVGRRADGADAEGSVDTSLARVGLADRYSRALGGVVDWQLSVAAYTEPDVGDASGTQVAAPLEVGWTMQAGPMGLRVHGGYDIALPPTALYAEADHVGVNTGLPARTAWGGGASLWARVGSALLTGRVDAEDVTGLPVWVEAAPDARDDIAWRPEPADARLVSWKAGVAVPRGSHATFAVEIAGEVADPSDDAWLHLPYRPSLRGRGRATFDVRGGVTVDLSAEHVGERYRIATEADRLAAYTRFGGRVAKMLTPAISVFVSAKATAGTYQTFESRHGSALHALDQGGVGVGLTGRI
ncbi:hypothetical protein HN766_04750 [Candidatus Poribacteria bacterium]|nr:hypothetical protein [Candidatus Poribacteria bacterium]